MAYLMLGNLYDEAVPYSGYDQFVRESSFQELQGISRHRPLFSLRCDPGIGSPPKRHTEFPTTRTDFHSRVPPRFTGVKETFTRPIPFASAAVRPQVLLSGTTQELYFDRILDRTNRLYTAVHFFRWHRPESDRQLRKTFSFCLRNS